jgi:hypothetical protein
MAVVIANTMTGGSKEVYDAVSAKVTPDGKLPAGCQVHVAGPVSEGWQVITVWDSADAFNQFRDEKLIPAIREIAGDGAIAPNIAINEVDTLLLG